MSSLFDVPAQLALVLSLAASAAGPDTPVSRHSPELMLSTHQNTMVVEPLEGPFRFSEGLWLRALKESAPADGASDYAGRVFKTSGGRFYVPAVAEREQILNARWDVPVASRVARAFAELNARRMGPVLGRAPTSGELYLAHVFGPETAVSLIRLAKAKPDDLAAEHFEELLETAPDALFDHGKPVTVAALYDRFTQALRERRVPAQVTSAGDADGAALSGPSLKPTLVGSEPQEPYQTRALAFAWRSEVKGAGGAAPLQ